MSEKHLDVKPGHIPVSHTSRPIITGSDSPARDPMMTNPEPNKPTDTPTVHKELNLKPPSLKAEDKTQPEAESTSVPESPSSELPQSVALNETDKVSPEDAVPALIADKTYKLPISPTPAKRLMMILVIVSVAIVALAVVAMLILSSR